MPADAAAASVIWTWGKENLRRKPTAALLLLLLSRFFPPWVFFERHRLAMWVFRMWAPKSSRHLHARRSIRKIWHSLACAWTPSVNNLDGPAAGNGN